MSRQPATEELLKTITRPNGEVHYQKWLCTGPIHFENILRREWERMDLYAKQFAFSRGE